MASIKGASYSEDQMSCETLRQQGNGFYKDGKVLQAIQSYTKAAAEAPSETAPYSNLSAAHFELGDYRSCVEDIAKALDLTDDHETLQKKLTPRLVKSHLYLKDSRAAEIALATLNDSPEKAKFSAACRNGNTISKVQDRSRVKLLERLPRYLPVSLPGTEFYPFGHDDAWPQVDEAMMSRHWKSPISIFFGGIGDARNLYATMIEIARLEAKDEKPAKRKYHVTMNDIKDGALARDLVMFYLLDDLSKMSHHSRDQLTEQLTALFFVFAAAVVPPYVENRVQETIKRAASALRSGTDLLPWFHIPACNKEALLRCLESWQGDLKSRYRVTEIANASVKYFCQDEASLFQMLGRARERKGCANEIDYYRQIGALWPPTSMIAAHESSLLIERENPMHSWKNARTHIRRNWKVNVTMLDRGWGNGTAGSVDGVLASDPFRLMSELSDLVMIPPLQDSTSLYEFVASFFLSGARSLDRLRDRLVVECVLGEVSSALEWIGNGMMDREKTFPKSYDRIHLSNIPDYIGGPLTSFIFALPMLKSIQGSILTANCLKNTPAFKNASQFHCEYLAVSDKDTINKLFQVTFAEDPDQIELEEKMGRMQEMFRSMSVEDLRSIPSKMLEKLGLGHIVNLDPEIIKTKDIRSLSTIDLDDDGTINPLAQYLQWSRTSHDPLLFSALLPRSKLSKWLFTMFFKIVVPANRKGQDWDHTLIYAPLNLTAFCRLLIHLQREGYPSHWLSEVLVQILEDQVITSARPPQTSPLSIQESQCDYPVKRLSTAPFVAEMATLTAMFLPLLPFSVIIETLPALDKIYEYTIYLRPLPREPGVQVPVFVLLFYREPSVESVYGEAPFGPPELRPILHPEGSKERSQAKLKELGLLRQKGIKLITTFNWNAEESRAIFWMSATVMDEMQDSDEWHCAMWRTDWWESVSMPVMLSKGARSLVSKGARWFDL